MDFHQTSYNTDYQQNVGPFHRLPAVNIFHYLIKIVMAFNLIIVLCFVELTFMDSFLYYNKVENQFDKVYAEITEGEFYRNDTDTDTSGLGEAKYSYSYTYELEGDTITRQGNFTAPYNKGDNIIIYIDPKDHENIELPQSDNLNVYYLVLIAAVPVVWLIAIKRIFLPERL